MKRGRDVHGVMVSCHKVDDMTGEGGGGGGMGRVDEVEFGLTFSILQHPGDSSSWQSLTEEDIV